MSDATHGNPQSSELVSLQEMLPNAAQLLTWMIEHEATPKVIAGLRPFVVTFKVRTHEGKLTETLTTDPCLTFEAAIAQAQQDHETRCPF